MEPAKAHLQFEMSESPLVVMRTEGEPTDAEHIAGLARLSELLRTLPRVAFVFEDVGGARLTMEQRRRQARWLKDEGELLRSRCRGVAFVFPSPVARFVLSSILLLTGTPMPYVVVAGYQRAREWAREQLRAGETTSSGAVR